ncbi:phosphatidylinositol-specific phospholipase C/glycerophosphodiester phosphodiesterase family protein [Streptomyces sp. NPDC051940]|uniref:phosphatidylinositol-specific phospholipase C/glycerophosphodiester phosphodiesterase family protein n=1 Tax=Streptomyces sp. NPDC051940 TaxID=3155675 RepID=UPI0034428121
MYRPTRRQAVATFTAAVAGGLALPATAARANGATPLRRAHAHNDYLHERPLHDALSHGFTSVEADIFLRDGKLLVAHEEATLDPARTLEALYLDPLARRVAANRGSVYAGHRQSVQLLIDIKDLGDATYRELSRVLRRYRGLFSYAVDGRVHPRAVTAVISGDRAARVPMEAEQVRYAFYDGRYDDLATSVPASFIPLVSGNWNSFFTWQGVGEMPAAERERLRSIIAFAHSRGQRVRFWATPDLLGAARDALWQELLAADVDHLNTDDLAGLETFLRARDNG